MVPLITFFRAFAVLSISLVNCSEPTNLTGNLSLLVTKSEKSLSFVASEIAFSSFLTTLLGVPLLVLMVGAVKRWK